MNKNQKWEISFHEEFLEDFSSFPQDLQDEILSRLKLLETFGLQLKRPYADTLKNPSHPNLKELRFDFGEGVWRIAYAFDPNRQAIILVAGNKAGLSTTRFYRPFIQKATQRFNAHLEKFKQE